MNSTEPNASNNSSNKLPPYPVETSMINTNPLPDPHTTNLLTAVQYGFYERVVELIDIDPQLATKPLDENITLLHWAAINNRIEIAKYLINKGARIDAIGGALQSTPLYWAVRDGKLEMTVFLISQGAQTTAFDDEGLACIHIASMFGYTYIVAYLIAKGDDVDSLDKLGYTPLMHAAQRIRNRDPTQILIKLGASVNHQNPNNKYTALHYAVMGNNEDAIHVLVEAGAKMNIRNSDNEDVFDLAAKTNNSRHLLNILNELNASNKRVPRCLQVDGSIRRYATKLFPYLVLMILAFVVDLKIWLPYKISILLVLLCLSRGYSLIFFDKDVNKNLPISIAQASIFWLYACYIYYFLPYIHAMSFAFIFLVTCTYFSWKNYYLAIKVDPGYIMANTDQQYRIIIQLAEQNLLNTEHFCTSCLIRRPLRSKHCRECRRCVARFDHHCPWVDNCVGDKTLSYFTGFIFFTPICLGFFIHGAYVFFREHCQTASLLEIISCKPSVVCFTLIAMLHILWISGLCLTILCQISQGFTTNERLNFWRYKYLRSEEDSSPFSFGWKQNLVDLINRRILWYAPTNFDWSRIYTLDDFNDLIPARLRRSMNNISKLSFNV